VLEAGFEAGFEAVFEAGVPRLGFRDLALAAGMITCVGCLSRQRATANALR